MSKVETRKNCKTPNIVEKGCKLGGEGGAALSALINV